MLGLKRGTVKLTANHRQWGKLYKTEKKKILLELKDLDVVIEHVGSTAVAGIMAKPIIDMMLGINNIKQNKLIYKKLVEIDYEDRGAQEVRGRRLFVKGPEEKRTHYLHITKTDSKFWKEHIIFRDYLKKDKKVRDEYNKLKIELAKKYSDNRKLYTEGKSNFIEKIIKR